MLNSSHSADRNGVSLATAPEERNGLSFGSPGDGGFQGGVYAREREEDETFQWHKLQAMLRRRRKAALVTFLSILGLGAAYYLAAPRIYQSQADLLISSPTGGMGASLSNDLPALSGVLDSTRGRSQETEAAILESEPIRKDALKRMPASFQAKNARKMTVNIRPLHATDIISVVVSGRDKAGTVQYANSICDAYLEQNQTNSSSVYRGTANFVKRQLVGVADRLDKARAALRDFKESNGIVDLSTESQARVKNIGELTAQLKAAQADSASYSAQLRDQRTQLPTLAREQETSRTTEQSPQVKRLSAQLTQLQLDLIAKSQEFTPNSPEVREVEGNITLVQEQLRGAVQSQVTSSIRQPNLLRTQVLSDISKTQYLINGTQARVSALQQAVAEAQTQLRRLPSSEYNLSQLQSKVAIEQQTYALLSDKYQTLLISQEAPSTNARIISHADESLLVSPLLKTTMLATLLLGLASALGIAALLDRVDDRIFGEEDARAVTGLPVLAQIPLLKNVERPLISLPDVPAGLLESHRMLRTQLVLSAPGGTLRTLVVTSSQPHEGKSTTASNIAIAMALNGRRVILVDCDLRRPHMHVNFDVANLVGLTSVVAGESSLEDALVESGVENLRLLPAGPIPPNPPELLDAMPTRQIIARLRDMADLVVIDSPPVLMMADAQITATMADGVVLVVSAREARRHATERAVSLIEMTGARLLGIVLNKQDTKSSEYYGYYNASNYQLDSKS